MRSIACNSCGSSSCSLLIKGRDRFYKIDDTTFDIVRCDSCGLVYLNPQPTAEELTKYYPAEYGPYQDTFTLLKYNPFLNFLKRAYLIVRNALKRNTHTPKTLPRVPEEKKTFLDFGCGSGVYLEKMRRLHPTWDLYGLDNSKFAAENTRAKGFNVVCGDLTDAAYQEGFFDEVYLSQVIEHVSDPRQTIRGIRNIMKSGGLLTLGTPNIDSVAAQLFRSYWFALEVPRHLFLFSEKTLSKILEEEGFRVVRVTYDTEPKTAIRSLDYLLGGNSVNINPIFWHASWLLLKPISLFLSYFGKTSLMTLEVRKI